MKREDSIRLRTYAQVWRLERVIYQIEGITLPFPVTAQQAGIFAGAAVLMAVLSRIVPGLAGIGAAIRYLAVPLAVTWFFTKQTLDGKPPHRWLWSILRYELGPKRLSRLRPIEAKGRHRFRLYAALRRLP